MGHDVILAYRRFGTTFTGSVDGKEFSDLTYADMMLLAQTALLGNPGAELRIQRLERDDLLPVQLEPALLALLKSDLAGYLKATTIPDRTITLNPARRLSKLAAPHVVPRGGLRVGHDTLAAAFGERVYLRVRHAKVEHPATGRWVEYSEFEGWIGTTDTTVVGLSDDMGWLVVKVQALLNTGAVIFYLPRDWNTYGKWITLDQLQEMYDEYKKAALRCSRTTAPQ